MKRLAVLAALVAMPAQAQAQSPAAWTTPTEPFKIAGNLYYVGTAGIGAYLITTPQGHILIDGA
ncbi:MAG: CAU/MBL1b family subclass B3 metallo-beta-lactamase, partial [Phenylobacterium sp.]|nr:CAU/MBL1b family subclass B3 metallo-beta-lactamase [Phenylobacterium sp.]